jgi:hypothetical protein
MKLNDDLRQVITELIQTSNYFNPLPENINDGEKVLQLYPSGLGWYGINLDGDIVSTNGEMPLKLEKENDSVLINVALYQATKKHPELSSLMPIRGKDDLTCHYCNGTGEHPLAKQIDILCYCGGLGWIPQT